MNTDNVIEFLRESNNIEDVWDDLSLQQAFYAWRYINNQRELTMSNMLKTHKILMLHQPLKPDEKGYLRKVRVWVGNREGMPHEKLQAALAEWANTANDMVQRFPRNDEEQKRIETKIKMHHVKYEMIHPFVDGNGRTGRIFMNWQRARLGLGIMVIKEQEKRAYYDWFQQEDE